MSMTDQALIPNDALRRVRNPLEDAWTLPPTHVMFALGSSFSRSRSFLSDSLQCARKRHVIADRQRELPEQLHVLLGQSGGLAVDRADIFLAHQADAQRDLRPHHLVVRHL